MEEKEIKVQLKRYRSAKSIVLSFLNLKSKNVLNKIVDAKEFIHVNKKMTIKEIINYLNKEQKVWAYCKIYPKINLREIHYWFKDDADLQVYDIASLLSHEIAHSIGIKSEDGANKYAAVTNFVLMILKEKHKDKLLSF